MRPMITIASLRLPGLDAVTRINELATDRLTRDGTVIWVADQTSVASPNGYVVSRPVDPRVLKSTIEKALGRLNLNIG